MIIAEDLLLLAYDDDTGAMTQNPPDVEARAAGAVLVELALLGRVDVVDADGQGGASRKNQEQVVVLDGAPVGHPVLDRCLEVVARQPQAPDKVLSAMRSHLLDDLRDGLAARGLLRRVDGRTLGLFPTTSWPAADRAHETALRATCRAVVLGQQRPDLRTAALLAVIHSPTFLKEELPRQERPAARARLAQVVAETLGHSPARRCIEASVRVVHKSGSGVGGIGDIFDILSRL